jgi:hypothetical protein
MTEIWSCCIENQSAMLAKQTFKSYKAQVNNCLKSIIFNKLHKSIKDHQGKITSGEEKIMNLCQKFLYSQFEADPLKLFGDFTTE